MKKMRRLMACLCVTAVFLMAFQMQAFAATKKITKVSLDVDAELEVGEDCDTDDFTIEPKTSSAHYVVTDIEIMNPINEWGPDDVPEIEVTLEAEDKYYFPGTLTSSDIKITGATYKKGRRSDSYTLILTMTLPPMTENVGDVTGGHWESEMVGAWDAAYNAGYYEVRLFRDGKLVGNARKTTENRYDFANMIKKEGTYTFKVHAVNFVDESVKSDWHEAAGEAYISSERASQLKEIYGSGIPAGVTEPGQMGQQSDPYGGRYGWILDGNGWWYRNNDGSYTTSNWQLINDKWYFFNSTGYMVTGWIDWNGKSYYCDPVNGDMLVNTVVPDGSGRRVDSTGAWIQ